MSPQTLAAIEALAPDVEAFREAILIDWQYAEALALAARRRTPRGAA